MKKKNTKLKVRNFVQMHVMEFNRPTVFKDKKKELKKGLKQNYYLTGREWPYKDVKRKIIAEKYMVTTKCIYKDLSLIYERMAFYFARV